MFSKVSASIQLAFCQMFGICLCDFALEAHTKEVKTDFFEVCCTLLCLSPLRVVLSRVLCVSPCPLILQGHPEDSYAHSHAKWQQIDLLSCFKTVNAWSEQWVNCVSSVSHPYLYLCLQSFQFGSQQAFKSE